MPSPGPEGAALNAPERTWRALSLTAWPLALGVSPWLVSADVPLCGFRHLTGLPCPLCGGTHACAALAQGDLLAAWQANPGLMPALVLTAAWSAQAAWEAWTGRHLTRWRIGAEAWQAAGACLLGAWGLRLAGWL